MIMIGGSAGFSSRTVGWVGRFFGSWPWAALIASSTLVICTSMLLDSWNWMAIWVVACTLVEVSWVTPGISLNCVSSGCATVEAMVAGLAPGYWARTVMVGHSTPGRLATGSSG